MPAPGPGGSHVDDFEGNALNYKWVATRYSEGGQNDGVWTRQVKDSKLYYVGVSRGTETSHFGEILSLPVNAPGDIIVDALIRQRPYAVGNTYGVIGIGFNQGAAVNAIRNGGNMRLAGTGQNWFEARNNGAFVGFPAFPSMIQVVTAADFLSSLRIRRNNNYMFVYLDGRYLGQFAFAAPITTVDMIFYWRYNITFHNSEKWVEHINVWPREVVK